METTIWFYQRVDIMVIWPTEKELTFRALAHWQRKSRNCGLYVVYIVGNGAALLVGAWQCEKHG